MQGRIGLLSTDNNLGSLKGGQAASVCRDTFSNSATGVSRSAQQRPVIKGGLGSALVYCSPQVLLPDIYN